MMLFWKKLLLRLAEEDTRLTRRRCLRAAGLDERCLRAMEPDARVEALERSHLDPYDYIYLAY